MSESINAEFEAYVKAELGDIAVVSDGRYISPKIQNYYKVWNHQQTRITELQAQLAEQKKDAERYQWLRDSPAQGEAHGIALMFLEPDSDGIGSLLPIECDKRIDAAIAEGKA